MSDLANVIAGLPAPEAISIPQESAVLAALKSAVTTRATEHGIDVSGIIDLEGEPINILLQAASFRELLLRSDINDGIRSNLIGFAAGADLDHLAAFYDVVRLANEADTALRSRVILAIQARSTGGSEYWYAAAALRSDARIRDVRVYREALVPIIHVAVLSSENGGVPDAAMLAAVEAEVTSDSVRLVNDQIVVEAAVSQTANITASIWLTPDAPMSTFDGLESVFRAAWDAETGIGFDLDVSWVTARLHVGGVKRVAVTAPAAKVAAGDNNAIALGTVALTMEGREY